MLTDSYQYKVYSWTLFGGKQIRLSNHKNLIDLFHRLTELRAMHLNSNFVKNLYLIKSQNLRLAL